MRNLSCLISGILLIASCATDTADPGGADEPAVTQGIQAPPGDSAAGGGATAAGLTWHFDGTESCRDIYPFDGCTSTKPSPQCVVTVGAPCPTLNAYCAQVRGGSSGVFREYTCY